MSEPERWTTRQAAAHCGVHPRTFRDYTRRLGAPTPVGTQPAHHGGATLLFDANAVRAWHAARPKTRRNSTKPGTP